MRHNGPNEPAFPRPCGAANAEEQNLQQDGMTMREWYAGQAVIGLLASGLTFRSSPPFGPKEIAQAAFNIADAMLDQAKK